MTMVGMKLRAADPAMQWFRRVLREEAAAAYEQGTVVDPPGARSRKRPPDGGLSSDCG
jgi:hypothetical protein